MSDPKPITPFFSTDPRMLPQPSDQPEPKLCECADGSRITTRELLDNRCATCGKAFA